MSSHRVLGFVASLLMLLGIILVAVYVTKHEKSKEDYHNKFYQTSATVTNISTNPYRCCNMRNCNKCSNGFSLPSCSSLLSTKTVGSCYGSPMCCRQTCSRKITYKDANGNSQFYYSECGSSSQVGCTYNCYCKPADTSSFPICESFCETCTNPVITVMFVTNQNQNVTTTISKSCTIGQYSCLSDFIGTKYVGGLTTVVYNVNSPLTVYFDKAPGYSMKSNHIVAISFGSIFMFVGLILAICACVCYPEEVSEDMSCICQCMTGLGECMTGLCQRCKRSPSQTQYTVTETSDTKYTYSQPPPYTPTYPQYDQNNGAPSAPPM